MPRLFTKARSHRSQVFPRGGCGLPFSLPLLHRALGHASLTNSKGHHAQLQECPIPCALPFSLAPSTHARFHSADRRPCSLRCIIRHRRNYCLLHCQ